MAILINERFGREKQYNDQSSQNLLLLLLTNNNINFERSTVDGRAGMATEPPYPRCFNLTLKDDSTKNFNIEIHKRVVDGPDMEQKVTEKVCRTFGINSGDIQSVLVYENRLNRAFTHGADDLVDAHPPRGTPGPPKLILITEIRLRTSPT